MKYLLIVLAVAVLVFVIARRKAKESKTSCISPPYSGEVRSINSEDYARYILIHNSPVEHIFRMVKEFGELPGDENMGSFDFDLAVKGEWIIIRIDRRMSFFAYHNLACWFHGYEIDAHNPDIVIGIARRRKESEKSYYFHLDPSIPSGDTQIGIFENGEKFFVYLPAADVRGGNLTIT